MAGIHRHRHEKMELERMDTEEAEPEDTSTTNEKSEEKCNAENKDAWQSDFEELKTQSKNSVISGHSTVDCDVCKMPVCIEWMLYCQICKQKFCKECNVLHDRFGGTRYHGEATDKCFQECELLNKRVADTIMKEQDINLEQLSSFIKDELGVQVCLLYDEGVLEIRVPYPDVLQLAMDTVKAISERSLQYMKKRVRHGAIEWSLQGKSANIVAKLFQNELKSLIETYDVVIKIKRGCEESEWSLEGRAKLVESKTTEKEQRIDTCKDMNEVTEIILSSNFENYYPVDCEVDGITDEAQTLLKTEIHRPSQDEFRMKMYAMLQENSRDVICHVENLENVHKLVILGREASTLEKVKQEFLSLFCKECSLCRLESSRAKFLVCKHVLCAKCIEMSHLPNTDLRCPVCSDSNREKTPVSSLQLQCLQAIDELLVEKKSAINQSLDIVKKKSSLKSRQLSTKIPKYLLNKWKKMTGGITRLKSMIENNYGFKVAGTGDDIRIYGQQPEILELAVQSLERLNEKTPENGITQRLAEKCVEWRLRGDYARIVQFLFNKELQDLKKKFKSVTIQAFTASEPTTVDVKCGYGEFLKVRYEMEELENELKTLITDECIQPKNFYHNVKIKEYLQSKRRDDKVHCSLVEKNNLNVVVIRGRKKAHVSAAKEQLLKW